MTNNEKNANRFTGFADIYENARPEMPEKVIQIITGYLMKKPDIVIDLGCGTGLSTQIWEGKCNNAIGIEPSNDMFSIAEKKKTDSLSFIKAFADNTGISNNAADAVICSQSFHWMNPVSTLREVNRILKTDGIFATVDCDWPPVCNWKAEKAYYELFDKIAMLEKNNNRINNTFVRYEKNNHLKNIKYSGYFRFTREIVFMNTERSDSHRFISLALSQGNLQTILKNCPELIDKDIEIFKNTILSIFNQDKFDFSFCYRMRIGIK